MSIPITIFFSELGLCDDPKKLSKKGSGRRRREGDVKESSSESDSALEDSSSGEDEENDEDDEDGNVDEATKSQMTEILSRLATDGEFEGLMYVPYEPTQLLL